MTYDQEVAEKRDRVSALRAQIRQEQSERAVEQATQAKQAKLDALSEEERMLEAQLEEVRSVQRPGDVDVDVVVPAGPDEGNVNVQGGPVRGDQDPLAEGGEGFKEVVDAHGNLVRVPLDSSDDALVELTPEGEAAGAPPADGVDPDDLGTREGDAPPPDVPENTTMGRKRR